MNTIAKQLHRLQLKTVGQKQPYYRAKRTDRRRGRPADVEKLRVTHRGKLLDVLANNPELSRSSIRRKSASTYSYLHNHDREWLMAQLPRRIDSGKPRQSKWKDRDAGLAEQVAIEAQRLRALPGRPVMISATAIAQNLEIVSMWKKRAEVIPLTINALLQVGETRDDCAVRRVEWAAGCFAQQRQSPASWRIALLAGVNGTAAKVPVVKAALEKAVAFLKAQIEFEYSNVA
jgi:hypothetical protein